MKYCIKSGITKERLCNILKILSENLMPAVSEFQQQVIKYEIHGNTTNRYANYSAGTFHTRDAFLKTSHKGSPIFNRYKYEVGVWIFK